jgi:hypothetical protein
VIQFNRYRLPDETPDFHVKFIQLVNAIVHEIDNVYYMHKSMDLLRSLAQSYPLNERIPAVAARMFFWGKCAWSDIQPMLPRELPSTFFYKQEIVGCVGFERAAREWGIDEDKWQMYQGLDTQMNKHLNPSGQAVFYQPRSSGFFSVIENIIAAQTVAEMDGHEFYVDLSGNWWNYHEPFDEVFPEAFKYGSGVPQMSFDAFRKLWLQPNDLTALYLADAKCRAYDYVMKDLYQIGTVSGMEEAGVMFVRGGDKLQAETIRPPRDMWFKELRWMARRCSSRIVLSDDADLAEDVCNLDGYAINGGDHVEGGYHHQPGRKVSCLPIINNYLKMVEAKENMSCPSANIVNAAQWSRCETENYSLSNPVYRYLLI